MNDKTYEYLPYLSDAEFKAVTGILRNYGFKGLVGVVRELAWFGENKSPESKALNAELESVTKRMETIFK